MQNNEEYNKLKHVRCIKNLQDQLAHLNNAIMIKYSAQHSGEDKCKILNNCEIINKHFHFVIELDSNYAKSCDENATDPFVNIREKNEVFYVCRIDDDAHFNNVIRNMNENTSQESRNKRSHDEVKSKVSKKTRNSEEPSTSVTSEIVTRGTIKPNFKILQEQLKEQITLARYQLDQLLEMQDLIELHQV